jgi:predicted MFS family arabinose efflux permease
MAALAAAAKTRAFWVLAGTFFVCGWTTNGLIGAHFIPAAHDHGMPTTLAAGLLAVVGIFDFVGTIASGWLTDKFDPALLLIFYYGLRGLALFTVPFVLGPTVQPPMLFFVVFYGLDWIATVPPTVELCRKYFGLEKSPLIYGWVFASHMIGAAVAAEFAGSIRDTQGDYFIAWITAAVLCLLAAGASALLMGSRRLAGR